MKVFLIILEAVVLALPILPFTRSVWPAHSTADLLTSLTIYLGLQVLILGALAGQAVGDMKREIARKLEGIELQLPSGRTRLIRDEEFYAEFLAATKAARSRVWVAYLAPEPPEDYPTPQRHVYYREHAAAVRGNTTAKCRRLIRDTPANRKWVVALMREFGGLPHVSLAIIKDREAKHAEPLALSVQVVDKDRAWLVAIEGHERSADYRDVAIADAELVRVFAGYSERLWNASALVLDSGKVTQEGQRLVSENG